MWWGICDSCLIGLLTEVLLQYVRLEMYLRLKEMSMSSRVQGPSPSSCTGVWAWFKFWFTLQMFPFPLKIQKTLCHPPSPTPLPTPHSPPALAHASGETITNLEAAQSLLWLDITFSIELHSVISTTSISPKHLPSGLGLITAAWGELWLACNNLRSVKLTKSVIAQLVQSQQQDLITNFLLNFHQHK